MKTSLEASNDDPRLAVLKQWPVRDWAWPRILVGIPKSKSLAYADEVFDNFMLIAANGPALATVKSSVRIDVVRNNMAKALLASNYTHLLMLDDDHVHPTDIIQRLAKWVLLDHEVKVVSGMNFNRHAPYEPVMGRLDANGVRRIPTKWPSGLISGIDEMGAASLLVHRSVFEAIKPPWFWMDYSKADQDIFPGEDIGFCKLCREAGIEMWIDTTTSSPHCTNATVTEDTFRAYIAMGGKGVRTA